MKNLHFDNSALKSLPLDPVKENFVRRNVRGACFSLVDPTPVSNPKCVQKTFAVVMLAHNGHRLVAHSPEALALLDLDDKATEDPLFTQVFSGCTKLPGSETAAHCYCGTCLARQVRV